MTGVLPHYCTGCGEMHGASTADSEAVRIAKINADRDVEVARLARSEARQEIEAEVEQTETLAEAAVEQTAIEAEAIIEAGAPEPEPDVPVVEAPVMIEAPDPEPEPETVSEPPEISPAPAAKKSAGWWDGYR